MSETKVPMPEPAIPVQYAPAGGFHAAHGSGKVTIAMVMPQPYYTAAQVQSYGDARASERDELWKARVAELERDAARWRWIEDNATSYGGGNGFTLTVFVPHDIEDWGCAIDAALSAGAAVEGEMK